MLTETYMPVALVRESDLKINTKCNINSIKKWPDKKKGSQKTSAYVYLSPKIKSLFKNLYNNIKTKYNRLTDNIYSERKRTNVRLRNSLVKVYISERSCNPTTLLCWPLKASSGHAHSLMSPFMLCMCRLKTYKTSLCKTFHSSCMHKHLTSSIMILCNINQCTALSLWLLK